VLVDDLAEHATAARDGAWLRMLLDGTATPLRSPSWSSSSRSTAASSPQGVIGAEVEATYALDQFPVALAHAQRTARTGKVLFTP
jgi:hypothetical protein